MPRPIILIFTGYFLPGFKAGGPIQSLKNIIDHFSIEYEFKIITSDRDLGDGVPYKNVQKNTWIKQGEVDVFYLSRGDCTIRTLKKAIADAQPDLLYFNSFFDLCFTIKPLLIRKLNMLPKKIGVVIAPRGEFSLGALALKPFKKKIFMYLAKNIGLYNNLTWQTSSQYESEDIKAWAGDNANVCIASNLPPKMPVDCQSLKSEKSDNNLRIVCLTRIARKKNIDGALRMLIDIKSDVKFDLYGPGEDKKYWNECKEIINTIPHNIKVNYYGQLPHEEIGKVLAKYDLFFMPTHGENFGHVILEALMAGLPVLISDLTPWRDLEKKGIGWDISLDCPECFQNVIEMCAQMKGSEYKAFNINAFSYAKSILNDSKVIESNRNLFKEALFTR